jgi:general stress protein 26
MEVHPVTAKGRRLMGKKQETREAKQEKTFRDVLEHFDNAMLVTRSNDGKLRGRPMAIARSEGDGTLWFFTSIESGKVDEILADPHCTAVMQGPLRYLSLSGRAELVRDRKRIDDLWQRSYEAWFKQGKDDPYLALIHFVAEEAEYWDSSGIKGLRYVFEVAKALARGGTIDPSKLEITNARLTLS